MRARLASRSATKLDLLAEAAGDDAAATWRPEVKPGELLGSITLRNGSPFSLQIPKPGGSNRGLPVYHPEMDLLIDP